MLGQAVGNFTMDVSVSYEHISASVAVYVNNLAHFVDSLVRHVNERSFDCWTRAVFLISYKLETAD